MNNLADLDIFARVVTAGSMSAAGRELGYSPAVISKRIRKLLLHKDEIIKLSHAVSAGGYTLVPLKLYFSDGRAKVEIAVAKGKHEWDKRQTLRERQDKREAERAMRSRNRLGD